MKSLKIGFASIIAILAISLTIAAQAGAFEAKKTAVLPDCYIPVGGTGTNQLGFKDICANPIRTFVIGDDCATDSDVLAAPGQHLFSGVDPSIKIEPDDLQTLCPGSAVVCCVFVDVDPTPCASQPQFALNGAADEYIISSVKCRN